MYISKIELSSAAPTNEVFWKIFEDCYNVHKLIWPFFSDGPERNRDFIYRHESVNHKPVFYCVSERRPHDPDGIWDILTKEYDPKLRTGQRLSFVLRANPVKKVRDKNGKQSRHDVVMDAKTKLKEGRTPKDQWPTSAELIQEATVEWLRSRGEMFGFELDKSMVRGDGYQQHRFRKGNKGPEVRFSTVDFTGVLNVRDPERFKETLFNGLGPSKGFGCGLMLVKP